MEMLYNTSFLCLQSLQFAIMVKCVYLEDTQIKMALQRCASMENGQAYATTYQIKQLLLGCSAGNSLDENHVISDTIVQSSILPMESINVLYAGPIASSCCSRQRNGGNLTLYNVNCNDQLRGFVQDCTYNVTLEYNTAPASGCTLYNELVVGCYEQSTCIEGDLRLRDGNNTYQGRVELCRQGLWGAISTFSWNYQDAEVVCRQLGYPWKCKLVIIVT